MKPYNVSAVQTAVGARLSTGYVPALDGLRAISIALVIAGHCGLSHIVPAGFGVTLFFFISGLLISRLLVAELQASGRINLPRFYFMRFLRLMPALYLYVALATILFAAIGMVPASLHVVAALFYWANYFAMYWTDAYNSFALASHPDIRNPFAVLWSLAVEEHFYFLFPAMLLLFRRHLRLLLSTILLLCVAALAWRIAYAAAHCVDLRNVSCIWAQYHNERASDTRFDSILFGVVATLAYAIAPARFVRLIRHPASLGVAVTLLLCSFAVRDPIFRSTLRYSLEGVALLAIVPTMLYAELGAPARRVLSWRPMLYVGRLSYSLYLFHWGATNFVSYLTPPYSVMWYVIVLVLTAGPTFACYHFVEMPIARIRRRFGSSAPAQAIPTATPEGDALSAASPHDWRHARVGALTLQ